MGTGKTGGFERKPGASSLVEDAAESRSAGTPGKHSLVEGLLGGAHAGGALAGRLRTPPVALPYRDELERQFGRPLDGIQAHLGEPEAVRPLGGVAAAERDVIAFAEASPSRATVAHEVTHVLQARSGTAANRAGAEAEADSVEANIESGAPPGSITQGATGVHLKSAAGAPPQISARALLEELGDIRTVVLHSLFLNKVAELHPYARYLETPDELLQGMFGYGSPGLALITPFHERIGELIAPESLDALVNKARRADFHYGAMVGPAHHVYMDSVGFELGNALTRRFQQSLTRMLPRYVVAAGVKRDAKDTLAASYHPQGSWLTPSHPLDRIVAHGLCATALRVDAGKFAAEHPEVVQAEDRLQGRTIQLRFPYERNLWHWVEATPADATPEEVALELFGSEDQAYRLTPMAPLFGFRNSDVARFVPARRIELNQLAAQHLPTRDDVDPAMELGASQGGEKLAIERAKLAAGEGDGQKHDEAAVYERAKDCLDLVELTDQAFVALELPTDVLAIHQRSFLSTQREAVETCFADADGQFALLDQQAKVLKRIAQGASDTAAHLPLYGGVGKEGASVLPSLKDLPDFARVPIAETAQSFADALRALASPELAVPRVERAEQLRRTLRISVLETSLHQTRPALQDAMDTPGDRHKDTADYDPMRMEGRNSALLAELSVARVQMEADPALAEKRFAETQERAGDYTFEVAIVSNLEALDAVWAMVEQTEDFWKSLGDEIAGNLLQARNRTFYQRFKNEVLVPYRTAVEQKDKAGKDAAKLVFKNLIESDELKDNFKQVQQHLKDDAKHKKWTKIIVGITIAVVAMGLGQWYFGAYLAAGGGVLAASIGAAMVETSAGAVLNKLILDVDPTAGSLITGLVGGGAMYSILGKALTVGRAAGATAEVAEAATKASLLQKAGKLAADTTKELLLVQALGLVQGEIANLIDHGKLLTEAQLQEMFVHNIAGLVGMKIGQRIVDVTIDPMKPLRGLAKQHAIDVDGLAAERAALEELAKRVAEAKDPVLAQKLVEREQIFLENMREARARLIELAEKHPGKVPAGQLKDLKAMPEHAPDAQVTEAMALMSLEEVGPNLYRADARAFDSILALHKQSGDRLVGVHTDPNTGLRTLEIQTADGMLIKVKEKLGDVGDRAAPPVPAAEAARFERWLESEMTHPDPVQADLQRQRLREYYARDPQGAMALAERYGFSGMSTGEAATLATKPAAGGREHPAVRPKDESDRAYDQFLHDQRGEGPQMSRLGEQPKLGRSDFDAMYKAGYEYDPVARRWVLAEGKTTAAGRTSAIGPEPAASQVLGSVHSEAVGYQVLRKLAAGEVEVLRMVGIEPPSGFDSRGNEWGLGRRMSDGQIVLVRGAKGEVNWSLLPGVEPLAHSHPWIDPSTGAPRSLAGRGGRGEIDVSNPLALGATATHQDLVYFLPSTGDLRFVALGGSPHAVMTPFIHLGEGRVGNPHPGMSSDTVDVQIVSAEAIGTYGTTPGGSMIVYKGKVRVMAGEREIGAYDIYQTFHNGIGDMPSFVAPPHHPLPADHPIAKATATPSAHISSIGNVQPTTIAHLMAIGASDPAASPAMMKMLGSLDAEAAGHLGYLAGEAVVGRVTGLADWVARIESQGGKDLKHSLLDLEVAVKQMTAEPGLKLALTAEGQLRFTDPALSAVTPPRKSIDAIADDVRAQVSRENPAEFELTWSDADIKRGILEGQRLGLTDQQINDLIRIAQRKDQVKPDGTMIAQKKISPDEMLQQMKNYVETVLPQGHPYGFGSREQFLEFSKKVRDVTKAAGLPTDDIRVQGSALRKPSAKDIDLAILIDDRIFDAQLIKLFDGKIMQHGKPVKLELDNLGDLVAAIRKDEASKGGAFNWKGRTLAHAFENRTIRANDAPGLSAAKRALEKSYGELDITIMSSGGYLDREPTMQLP